MYIPFVPSVFFRLQPADYSGAKSGLDAAMPPLGSYTDGMARGTTMRTSLIIAGLFLVAAPIGAFAQTSAPSPEAAPPPNEQKEPPSEAVEGSGTILVARKPIGMLASPSPSAPVLYGFPAGRPFHLLGRDGGFAHIQDLKSSASGWVDEAELAPSEGVPVNSATPQPDASSPIPPDLSAGPTPKTSRPGLFGGGGLLRGIFGN